MFALGVVVRNYHSIKCGLGAASGGEKEISRTWVHMQGSFVVYYTFKVITKILDESKGQLVDQVKQM